jgi:hypothetical protein
MPRRGSRSCRGELKSFVDKVAKREVRPPSSQNRGLRVTDGAYSHLQTEHSEAERGLQEERATLTQFDTELRDLDEVVKVKK